MVLHHDLGITKEVFGTGGVQCPQLFPECEASVFCSHQLPAEITPELSVSMWIFFYYHLQVTNPQNATECHLCQVIYGNMWSVCWLLIPSLENRYSMSSSFPLGLCCNLEQGS